MLYNDIEKDIVVKTTKSLGCASTYDIQAIHVPSGVTVNFTKQRDKDMAKKRAVEVVEEILEGNL